ncbi:hypothetical protein ACFLU5_03315 [Bacteroidota bacterium]
MVAKYLDIFNFKHVLLIIFTLSVHNTLATSELQDSLISVRDSLRNLLDETNPKWSTSTTDQEHLSIFKSIVTADDNLISMLYDSLESKKVFYETSVKEYKSSLAAVNNKLDLVNDRRGKLERTVLILVLVLMMLTYYVFKLQRKKSVEED